MISASFDRARLAPAAGSLERVDEAALSPSAPRALIYRQILSDATVPRRVTDVTPLAPDFLQALAGHDEVLVTSREGSVRGTVPVWFVVVPPGVVYLFGFAFSTRARRWRSDPWVRLSVPGGGPSVEAMARFVAAEEVDEPLAATIVDRWAMQGAPTREGLRRTLRDGVHVLGRVAAAVD